MADNNNELSQALKKLEEQLRCRKCLKMFANPKILPCFHSFCLGCLEGVTPELVEGHYKLCLPCPTCRSPCPNPDKGLASLPSSFLMNNLSEVYNLLKKVSGDQKAFCDNCDKTNANRYCKQCSMFFCPECLHHHDKFKPNVDHQTLSLEEVANTAYQLPQQAKQENSTSCACIHHNKPLEIFCETCEKLICQLCTFRKHTGHDYDVVSDMYKKHHDMIAMISLEPLNKQFDRLSQDKASLTSRRAEINLQSERLKEEIFQNMASLKQLIDETETKLVSKVEFVSQLKAIVLEQQIKEVEKLLDQVRECRDHIEQSLKVGTPEQVLAMKDQMFRYTENVISSVKDKSFYPLEQADIELLKSDKISKVLQGIGQSEIKYTSVIPSTKAHVSYSNLLISHESAITITFTLPDGSAFSVPSNLINCKLSPADQSQNVQCSLKESNQLGRYYIIFIPIARGLHRLHVKVGDSEISGSPFSISVSVPPEMRGVSVKTISGLKKPSGIAVTRSGQIVVCERDGHCISIFCKDGTKIKSFASFGKKRGQLWFPEGIAISSMGNLLIVDASNHRIQEFTIDGECISCIGSQGNDPLQFNFPKGIAVNRITGQIYIADRNNDRVQVLNSDRTFSHTFGSDGSLPGQFDFPFDVVVDSEGLIYIADYGNHRIQKFTPDGQFISTFGTLGSRAGQLCHPSGIAVNCNLVYVSDENGFVSVFTTDGKYDCRIQKKSNKVRDKKYLPPVLGIDLDTDDNLYVCNDLDGQIEIF